MNRIRALDLETESLENTPVTDTDSIVVDEKNIEVLSNAKIYENNLSLDSCLSAKGSTFTSSPFSDTSSNRMSL